MTHLYFAYGSNLASARLRERVPSAVVRGVARAPGFALRIDKLGADGSAKANLHPAPDPSAEIWGAVYAIDAVDWPGLDACETGYARIEIDVWLGDARTLVQTYSSERLTSDPVPLDWYKRLMVDGAREHGLPDAWCALLSALPSRDVPR
ncbi:MAG: gamma-glutamylcyclotransferase [Myxococcales bacterium]|nr:gamma-glutamylcyclotransferase [Myxococcales bacterium]